MDLDAVRALALDVTFDVMAVPATVARPAPDDTPVATTGIWLAELDDPQAYGVDLRRSEPRRMFAIRRTDELPIVPRGSVVVAPELIGRAPRSWRVEEVGRAVEPDLVRVILVPARAEA